MVNEVGNRMIQKQSSWVAHKKWWLVGGGSLLGLLLFGGVVVWSVLSWQDYEQKYTSWHSALRVRTDEVLALPAKTTQDRDKKGSSLATLRTTIGEGAGICARYQIIHWQQFIPEVKKRIDHCHEVIEKTDRFGVDMSAALDYLGAEQSLTKILSKGSATKLEESAWKQQPQIWSEVEKQIMSLEVPDNFKPIRQLAAVKSKAVREAWQALVASNDAKDRAKYEEAGNQLSAAYDAFGEVSDMSEKTFLPLVTALEKSYSRAFR